MREPLLIYSLFLKTVFIEFVENLIAFLELFQKEARMHAHVQIMFLKASLKK